MAANIDQSSPKSLAEGEPSTTASSPPRVVDPRGALLILLNPGNVTRHCLIDMVDAARRLGLPTLQLEIGDVWALRQAGKAMDPNGFARLLREHHVRAVLGYTLNGLLEWPCTLGPDGRPISFFEQLGIPQLMWWTDHPQWASERVALDPKLQPLLASANCHHFVKSDVAARELRDILGWANCYGLAVAENPDRLQPSEAVEPQFDIVAVMGSPPSLGPALERFLEDDDPGADAISRVVAGDVVERLDGLWTRQAPPDLQPALGRLGRKWTEARCREPLTASYWIFRRLEQDHPAAARWLRDHYRSYFDALETLWELGRWQRTFIVRYLAKYFRVGVFGSDWSRVGLPAATWINYHDQSAAYARGRLALNVSQAGDEEGVSHKPFQIAASGVPMLHINRPGLGDCFAPGEEVAVFGTPRQARDIAAALLADPDRRARMAVAARERLIREHTWTHRLLQMLTLAGIRLPGVHLAARPPLHLVAGRGAGLVVPQEAEGPSSGSPTRPAASRSQR